MNLYRLTLFILLWSCQTNSNKLPVLSYNVDKSGNIFFYKITYEKANSTEFTNQLGIPFSNRFIKNKVFITNFFFTRCPSICPPMRQQLIAIAQNFKNDTDFIIISHTIDPKNDTVSILKSYSGGTGIATNKWFFLHGTLKDTKTQALKYMTNFRPKKDGIDFFHSSYVALVDKKQNLRGFYNILMEEDIERLKEAIAYLLLES